MGLRYQKTESGREEIRARRLDLSRPARTLLLIVDTTKAPDEWLQMVKGASAADFDTLLQLGLVSAAEVAAAPEKKEKTGPTIEEALEKLGYRELYDRLTQEARPRLGLMKGYRIVLEIEKCTDVFALRQLALRVIEDVRVAQGDAAASELRRALGAGR